MIALVNSSTVVQAQDSSMSSMYDMFEQTQKKETASDRLCKEIVASDLADKFLKAYLSGKTAEADRIYALMLKKLELGKSESSYWLCQGLYAHIQFDVPDDASLSSIYSRRSFFTFIALATEKAVGKYHRFMLDPLALIAKYDEGARNWKDAEAIRIRRTQICEKCFGKEAEPTLNSRVNEVWDKMQMQQYSGVEPVLKQVIEQSKRHGCLPTLQNAVKDYALFLRLSNRRSDYDKLMAEYSPHRH
jgi:hypothetical protein